MSTLYYIYIYIYTLHPRAGLSCEPRNLCFRWFFFNSSKQLIHFQKSSKFKFRRGRNTFQSDFWIYNIIIIISKLHLYTTTYFYYIFLFYFETVEKVSLKDVGGVVCVYFVCVYTNIFETFHPKKTIVFPSTLHPNILH